MVITVRVRNVMNKDVISVNADDSIWTAVNTMVTNDIGAVTVVSGKKLVGILTERDILKKIVMPRLDPANTQAQKVMSSPLITIEADATLSEAARLMVDRNIRRLLVTEGGEIVGIVTQKDLQHQILDVFTALAQI